MKTWAVLASIFVALPGARADTLSSPVLQAAAFRHYIDEFNREDTELYPQSIRNNQAWDWMEQNVPLFECPDHEIESTYYFRWWTYRKHIEQTPDGYVITEFLPPVPWAGKWNTIPCAAGHHFYEGRWIANPRYLDEYARFWFRPGSAPRRYSFWAADAIWARHMVEPNPGLVEELLPQLVANFDGWVKERRDANGLFWQNDGEDGMEVSIGGTGYRATINSYMFGEAQALAKMARLAGQGEIAARFDKTAAEIRQLVLTRLWDPSDGFFKVLPRGTGARLVSARELHGYTPWYFGLPDRRFDGAWKELMDPQGFYAPYGPTTAEQRCSGFRIAYAGHECQWNGPSWPYSTSVTLVGLANLLNGPPQTNIDRGDYLRLLHNYAASQHLQRPNGPTVHWIDENLNPFTGDWIARTLLNQRGEQIKARGKDYNHSTFCDLVITGLVGLRPQSGDAMNVHPLAPPAWDYFCLDHLRYRGHWLSIFWDKSGQHYGHGAGLHLWLDGKSLARSDSLDRIEARSP